MCLLSSIVGWLLYLIMTHENEHIKTIGLLFKCQLFQQNNAANAKEQTGSVFKTLRYYAATPLQYVSFNLNQN